MCRAPALAIAIAAVASIIAGVPPARGQAVHELSLADAVRTAIASDAEIYIAREDARVAADGVSLARAAFSPVLFGEVSGTRVSEPASATSFHAIDAILAATFGVSGRVETGLSYKVAGGIAHESRTDSYATVYDDATTTTVRAEVVQPLWRGAFAAARRPIEVASFHRNRSEHELRARIERTVGAVQIAYWDLVRARGERDARASALELASEQVEESKGLRRLGTGSDLDVLEAEAGASRRRQELLRSEQLVVEADGRLFASLGVRAGQAGWDAGSALVPIDTVEIEPHAPEVEAQLALARARRADVLAANALIAAETGGLALTDDQRRAALDLVVAAGTAGFAGTLARSNATAGVNSAGLDPPYRTDPAYDGGLSRSLRNTLGHDLNLFVGLRFEMALGEHETEVRHSMQRRAVARARLGQREVLARIETEVRTTVASVALNAQVVAAADRTVQLSEQLLEGTRKRFRAGDNTTFDVLRVSEELTRARIEAARARADYRVSLARLAAATGTMLDGFGITIRDLGTSPR